MCRVINFMDETTEKSRCNHAHRQLSATYDDIVRRAEKIDVRLCNDLVFVVRAGVERYGHFSDNRQLINYSQDDLLDIFVH